METRYKVSRQEIIHASAELRPSARTRRPPKRSGEIADLGDPGDPSKPTPRIDPSNALLGRLSEIRVARRVTHIGPPTALE